MKILHTADIHFSREHQVEALASLTTLAETAEREKPAFVTISGDLFDRGAQNSTAGGFPALLAVIQRILDVCPIAAVAGTPTHDLPGCYDALMALGAEHSFVILTAGVPYLLDEGGDVVSVTKDMEIHYSPNLDYKDKPRLLILGCPEPSREWLLAGKEAANARETGEAMKIALRSILLGLGAIRAQHPELPCVMLYHGPVEGASMQNGQVIGAGSITIGREDLAPVGADYYALGDIHLAQQIPGLPAYYPGSAYPVNWGELGQSGFNLVELGLGACDAAVTRVPYPHPRRCKFVVTWPEPAGPEVEGVQAWVCYRATKEQAAQIDTDAMLEAYLATGALPGSRVTVELIPTETVRAAEITEKHRLREKVTVYAEASNFEPPGNRTVDQPVAESVLLKADLLEREATERGAAAGFHFRLRRLRLRGAIGVWKGQRKDEVDYNLDGYDPGLIAMIGVNGSAKSTVIENMHPYPCMLTRDGKLQDHFRLRDSTRELWFCDERTGTEYRALMEIDGANASGVVKYHLFRAATASEETPGAPDSEGVIRGDWEPLTNGRKEDYEQAITGLIGSLPLFLRSAFVSQRPTKNNPDLSDATKGERKAIFRELAGLDYLQAYAESAKARAGAIEGSITTGRGQVTLLERFVAEEPEIAGRIDWSRAEVQNSDAKIEDLTATGKECREKVETLHVLKVEQEQIERDAKAAEQESIGKGDQAEQDRKKIIDFHDAVNRRKIAKENIDYHAQLKEQEGKESERLSKINAERARRSTEYSDALKAHAADVRGLEVQRTRLRTEKARLEQDHAVFLSQYKRLEGEVEKPLTDECPECGAEREHWHKDLNAGREEKQAQFREIGEKIHALGNQIMSKDGEIIEIIDPPAPEPLDLPPADETELTRIRAALGQLDITAAQKVLEAAAQAEAKIAELTARIETLEADARSLNEKAARIRASLDPSIAPAHEEAVKQYEQARADYTTAKEERATAAAKLEAAEKQLAAITKQKCELEELRTSLVSMEAEAAEWRYLETACGPDGIQALELDAMGPGIAEVANRLLSAAYGSRFSIELRTTRMAGKGSKTRQVEDFAIIVLDNELLSEQPIETLSGGESVWIKQAIYAAFSIVRDKTTGIRFLTCFKDECDGALDPESRAKYFQLLEVEHNESGRRHTLIITHSESAQEMIPQRIMMQRTQ